GPRRRARRCCAPGPPQRAVAVGARLRRGAGGQAAATGGFCGLTGSPFGFFSNVRETGPTGWVVSGLRTEAVPVRGVLRGSVSHPWLTRRRSASLRSYPHPPDRDGHRPLPVMASIIKKARAAGPAALAPKRRIHRPGKAVP